ncbi:MAG TPA: DUF4838 domain-containing protein [Bacteroidales bacterium]|nr:DUF4838 domain-containing protein [Bacteroidales bacterium]
MKTVFTFLLSFVFLTGEAQNNDSLTIISKGKANYCIQTESPAAANAACILQQYVDSVSGVLLPISAKKVRKNNTISFVDYSELAAGTSHDSLRSDGFIISTVGKNIYVYAKNAAGFRNAVFYFLEHELGCRFYAVDAKLIPKNKEIKISPVNTLQNPAFEFRTNYNGDAFNKEFGEWHGLHNKPRNTNTGDFEISEDWGLWVHTLHTLVPPEKWFDSHPEYFALRNGVRVKDQLCLSNPDVLNISIASLREEMKEKPEALYWSVSQMDNFNYCMCDKCRAIDEANGSPSGSVISFVNAIAKEFPDKIISTLAYQYSRKTPLRVKPLPNVNIMLCTIECDRNKPISQDSLEGSFTKDLNDWGALTDNVLIWDYVINFSNIIGPFPNFHVLKPNLQLFEKNHVSMVFEQGWPHNSGEFTELRCYVLAKLLWDPSLDTDSLMQDFCNGYYGPGGKYVYHYIQLATQNLLASGKALTLYEPMSAHAQGFLSPENIDIYFDLFDDALMASHGNKVYYHRIQMAMQPLRYAWLEVAKSLPFTDDWLFEKDEKGSYRVKEKAGQYLRELCDTASIYGPVLFHETSIKPQEYYGRMSAYFENGIQVHKAVGKSISFVSPPSPKYSANGPHTLIDGVCGTDNYFSLWQGWYGEDIDATIDLGSIDSVSSIQLNCLINQASWIFAPESITVRVSNNGNDYSEIATYGNAEAKNKMGKSIVPFRIEFSTTQKCRFLNIKLKNIGALPEWHGSEGKTWIFVDEIIVR